MKVDGFELLENERLDDLQRNNMMIIQDPDRFCFGVDAVFLSGFVKLSAGMRCADLGTGTGILPILLSAKTDCRSFVGIELQEESADMARRSVRGNGLTDVIDIVTLDLRKAVESFGASSFDAVVTNPPYTAAGSGLLSENQAKNIARTELFCTLKDVVTQGAGLLRPGGFFCMVHRPQRMAEIVYELKQVRLEPKRIRFVHPKKSKPANLFLIEAVKDAGSGITVEPPLIIHEDDGNYTEEIKKDYGF